MVPQEVFSSKVCTVHKLHPVSNPLFRTQIAVWIQHLEPHQEITRLLEVPQLLQQPVSLLECQVLFLTQTPLCITTPPHNINFTPSSKVSGIITDMVDTHSNLEVPSRVDSVTLKLWDKVKATVVPLTTMIKVTGAIRTIPDQAGIRTRAVVVVAADIVVAMRITIINIRINTILSNTADTVVNPTVWAITDTLLEE